MEKIIGKFLLEYKKKNRKRFETDVLEKYVIGSYKSKNQYLIHGGYNEFYHQMMKLKEKNTIKEIKSSQYNGLNPPLKTRWQIVLKEPTSTWDQSKILRFSDYLDFSYYINHPSYQTEMEWEYIENIYEFLKFREGKQWASVEERSLELFYDEKFITGRKDAKKGRYGILSRLKLSYEDLKMKKYGEMFIYWNRGVSDIKNIIILENHSTFFTYKRIVEDYGEVLGFVPDALIYGEGKKIEQSFSFIEEISDIANLKVFYFGDIDSEGFGIYYRLRERYPHVNIQLQQAMYVNLISICNRDYPLCGQKKNEVYLDCFLKEMKESLDSNLRKKLSYIWDKNLRIPQELISYEYLMKVRK